MRVYSLYKFFNNLEETSQVDKFVAFLINY